MTMAIKSKGITHVGLKREHNEDVFHINEKQNLFIVADGMGGHVAGEIAARIAVETINEFVQSSGSDLDITWPFDFDENLSNEENMLSTAVKLANVRIVDEIQKRKDLEGMGTTLVTAMTTGRWLYAAHIGDSRLYLIRGDTMTQLTNDHSWVGEQVRLGILTPHEAARHPYRNVVTRALGSRASIRVDLLKKEVEDDDYLLLCSDGLSTMVSDERIKEIITEADGDLDLAAVRLVDEANDGGGEDNITIILVHYTEDD